MKEGKKEG